MIVVRAKQVLDWSIDKLGVSIEIVIGKLGFAALLKLQNLGSIEPTHLVDHSNHMADLFGLIGYAPVPEADIADYDTAFRSFEAYWWSRISNRIPCLGLPRGRDGNACPHNMGRSLHWCTHC